ncbi:MAG: alanine racemase, partial [Planctomycetota bacterium]
QVNCSGEESKYGCHVPAAIPLAEQIDQMYSVNLRGVMTMAPYSDNPEDARGTFSRCRELFDEIKKLGVGDGRFNLLSMGMSGDYEVAIEEGANVVRVGSAIFGTRDLGEEPEA